MAWCHLAPSHYINQCWFIVRSFGTCVYHVNAMGMNIHEMYLKFMVYNQGPLPWDSNFVYTNTSHLRWVSYWSWIHLVAVTKTTILVPYHFVRSLQLIWRLGTRRWKVYGHPIFRWLSSSDLTEWVGTSLVAPVMTTRATSPIAVLKGPCYPTHPS